MRNKNQLKLSEGKVKIAPPNSQRPTYPTPPPPNETASLALSRLRSDNAHYIAGYLAGAIRGVLKISKFPEHIEEELRYALKKYDEWIRK